LELPGL